MKKKLTIMLVAALSSSLVACSSSGETAKPVVEEVKITKDNLLEYFELSHEPYLMTATDMQQLPPNTDFTYYADNATVEPEFRDSQYNGGFFTCIKLRDEYVEQLDFNDENTIGISFKYTLSLYTTDGDGKERILGEQANIDTWFNDAVPEASREVLRKTYSDQGNITEEGFLRLSAKSNMVIADEQLIENTTLIREMLYYRTVSTVDEHGIPSFVYIISEGPCYIIAADSLEWTSVTGTLYLHKQ